MVNAVARRVAEGGAALWEAAPEAPLPDWLAGPVAAAWGAEAVGGDRRGAPAGGADRPDAEKRPEEDWAARARGGAAADRQPAAGRAGAGVGAARATTRAPGGCRTRRRRCRRGSSASSPAGGRSTSAPRRGARRCSSRRRGAEVTALDLSEARLGRLRAEPGAHRARGAGRGGGRAGLDAGGAVRRDRWSMRPARPAARSGGIPTCRICGPGASSGRSSRCRRRSSRGPGTGSRPAGGSSTASARSCRPRARRRWRGSSPRRRGRGSSRRTRRRSASSRGGSTRAGGLRLRPDYWPERGGMDGFYAACLAEAGRCRVTSRPPRGNKGLTNFILRCRARPCPALH